MGEPLVSTTRQGTKDTGSEDTGKFPFEGWEFTLPTDPTPTVTLRSPWKLAGNGAGLTSLPSDTTKAPLPQVAAGAGQWGVIVSASGGVLNLPAGGTWAWVGWQYNAGTGAMVGQSNAADVEAGGTQICDGASVGFIKQAKCWEILDAKGFDFSKPIYVRADGSFVITAETGHPYHVITHEQAGAQGTKHDALYDRVAAYVAAYPESLQLEPEVPAVKSNPEVQLAQEILADYIDSQKQTKKWQDRKAEILKAGGA